MAPTKKNIDKALREAGFPEDFEIVKGKGYIYFSGGNSLDWESTSVMIPFFSMQSVEQWVNSAIALSKGEWPWLIQ